MEVVVFYLIFDTLVIRSGWYFKYVEPDSIAGSVLLNQILVRREFDPTRDNILVLGDSQVGEGFSAKLANEQIKEKNLNFIGCGISGSTPRVWRYFLRKIDPDRKKFAAIVLMAAAYTDEEGYEDFGNRGLDINYCLPLLKWSDLRSFSHTFPNQEIQQRAESAIIFPLSFVQSDLKQLLLHPSERIHKVELWRSGYPDWIYDHPGHAEFIPDLEFEKSPVRPKNWQGASTALQAKLEGYFPFASGDYSHPPSARTAAYRERWYGGIAGDYKQAGVPVFVFLMPRGPFHHKLAEPVHLSGTFDAFARGKIIRFLPAQQFEDLEVPENFFDQAHLNAIGRKKLTALLAQEMIAADGSFSHTNRRPQ